MSAAAKVGIFMVVILAILAFFILKVEDIGLGRREATKEIDVIFDDVAGLDEKAKVRVAGVPVGTVKKIHLPEGGKAKVTLEIDRNIELHQGANARVTSLGLLGEKYVEIEPGDPRSPVIGEATRVVLIVAIFRRAQPGEKCERRQSRREPVLLDS